MKILVLGGDGFCGWPLSLHLSKNHEVTIADNFSRREIDAELGTNSLTPITELPVRLKQWEIVSGIKINFNEAQLLDYSAVENLFKVVRPDAIVHLAELRSAPYSMLSSEHRRKTVHHNVTVTQNILEAMLATDNQAHLVHVGTMGVYGYQSTEEIPEGYVGSDARRGLFPHDPGSIYHVSKGLDHSLLQYYQKNWEVRVTELHQGIIWGTQTSETLLHPKLYNRYDYDGEFGTVVNRFVSQAVSEVPLTVYGDGSQSRAFLSLRDSIRCITWAIENHPGAIKSVRVFNQFREILTLNRIAEMIGEVIPVKIDYLPNPRSEILRNKYRSLSTIVDAANAVDVFTPQEIEILVAFARNFTDRFEVKVIPSKAKWRNSGR